MPCFSTLKMFCVCFCNAVKSLKLVHKYEKIMHTNGWEKFFMNDKIL